MSLDSIQQEFKTEFETYLDWLVANSAKISTVTDITSDSATASTTTYIMLSYIIDDLFIDAKMQTAIRARSLKDQAGKSMLDAYAIANDDRDWFDKELKTGAKRIFNAVYHMSKNIVVPYLYDSGVIITTYSNTTTYAIGDYVRYDNKIYKALVVSTGQIPTGVTDTYWELQSAYVDTKGKVVYFIETNTNIPNAALIAMDGGILTALRLYILKQWYKIAGLIEESGLNEQEYTNMILQIRRDSYMRIKGIVRPATDLSL